MNVVHATLEPNEENTDGCAVTLYTKDASHQEVVAWLKEVKGKPGQLAVLSVDVNDPCFEVLQTKCPFEGVDRWQAHPTC